jgi:hypothetical protein
MTQAAGGGWRLAAIPPSRVVVSYGWAWTASPLFHE